VASVLTVGCQLQGPWNTEVAWGLEDNVVGSRGAVASAEEGEVSEGMLIGCEGVTGKADDDGERPIVC
jgi:hypothetical protein